MACNSPNYNSADGVEPRNTALGTDVPDQGNGIIVHAPAPLNYNTGAAPPSNVTSPPAHYGPGRGVISPCVPEAPYGSTSLFGFPELEGSQTDLSARTEPRGAVGRTHAIGNTPSAHVSEEDMASVVRLLQDAIPKLTSSLQGAASPAAATISPRPSRDMPPVPPLSASTLSQEGRPPPSLSPVLIVGHHLPNVPIIAIDPSLGASPRVWGSGSCFLFPPADERTPLVASHSGPILSSRNHTTQTNLFNSHNDLVPRNRNSRFSREQIMVLISMLLVDFSSFASMSIMAPFYPEQVNKRNLSSTIDGIIFSVYAFVIVVTSPVIGKMLPMVKTKNIYMAGIMVAGIGNICFGMVVYIENPELFVILSIIIRVFVAFGSACFLTVIYTLVPILFPDDINTVNGMLETAVGVGMCVGPAVGVWLYSLGGFSLPFYGLGGFILVTFLINMRTFPQRDLNVASTSGVQSGIISVLLRPGAFLPLAILCATAVCLAILYPTLQPHMDGLGVSVEGVGLVFLLMSAVYAVSSPLVGLATDRYNCPSSFMLAGLLLLGLGLTLLGNSPLLPYVTHDMLYKQDVIAIVFIGLASAMSIVPTFASIVDDLSEDGTVDIATFSVVAGLWSASYSLGEMLGPVYAGLMAEYVSFATSTTVTALLPTMLAIVQGFYMCADCCRSQRNSSIAKTPFN